VEGLSPARNGSNWGFIDTSGNWVIEPKYLQVSFFSEGLAGVHEWSEGGKFPAAYIDKTGHSVISFPEGVSQTGPFSEGLAAVRQISFNFHMGKLGYIDRTGALAISYQFADGGPFHEGLAAVVFDGQCYVEGRDGGEPSTPPSVAAPTDCGGVPSSITKPCSEGFINRTGKVVLRFDGVRDFSEGLAAVKDKGQWGFIEPGGKFVIAPRFEAARSFSEGLAAAEEGGRWGFVDRTGKWAIRPQFVKVVDFSGGLVWADGVYIDKTGKQIASAKYGTSFVQGLADVLLDEKTLESAYIDRAGKVIFRYGPPIAPR
jgi:hypothetical protein